MRKTEEVPAYHEMMQELFQAIKELGGSGTIQEIDDKTIEILGLSPEVLTIMHGDTSKSEVEYRLAWTRTYMKKVGILENSARGVWALTTVGRELQEINSDEIVKKVREMTLLKMKDTKEISLEDHNLENDGGGTAAGCGRTGGKGCTEGDADSFAGAGGNGNCRESLRSRSFRAYSRTVRISADRCRGGKLPGLYQVLSP